MVVEIWLNLELLERYLLEKEEKERLVKELISTIEKSEITEGKVVEYLKVYN